MQYFRPSLSYHLSLRSLFSLILSGRFTQVLLYFNSLWSRTTTLNSEFLIPIISQMVLIFSPINCLTIKSQKSTRSPEANGTENHNSHQKMDCAWTACFHVSKQYRYWSDIVRMPFQREIYCFEHLAEYFKTQSEERRTFEAWMET